MSPTGSLQVRLDRDLLATARERAEREDRTIASLARLALKAYLHDEEDAEHEPKAEA